MIKSNQSKLRILSLVVLAALLLALLPSAALADSFSAAVKVKKMKVYADPRGAEYIGSLPNKTIVTVQDYSGGVAKIKYNGVTGYAKVSDMRSVESFAEEAKTNTSTRVYAEANPNSASAKLKSGVKVYVLAEKNGIAMIEKDGKVGYVNARGEVTCDFVYGESNVYSTYCSPFNYLNDLEGNVIVLSGAIGELPERYASVRFGDGDCCPVFAAVNLNGDAGVVDLYGNTVIGFNGAYDDEYDFSISNDGSLVMGYMGSGEYEVYQLERGQIVPQEKILEVAGEFMREMKLPSCIEWEKL